MSDWRDLTLGEFVALQRGHDLTEPQRRAGRVPVMGSAGQNGFHDTALANGPGIVIGRSGASFGQVHFSEEDFWPHNTGLYVTDFKGNDPLFAFYFLKALDFYRFNSGSAQPSLNRNFIYPIPIRVPKPAEQKAIAAVLGALDDKIELNRRMNATLEAMARALFQSWFVDFDPVRAKLDGREPIGMDAPTAALFPAHFDHKAEGVVPTGWNLKRWGDIATLEYGKSIRDYRESSGKYRVWGTNGPIGFHEEALCNSAGIVIGRKGAYRGIHYSPEPFFVIDTAFYLKPKAALDLKWAYYELLRFDINSMDSGSAIPSTSRDDFYGIPVIVPPPAIQVAFGQIVGGWFSKVFANDSESRTLATLRDTLLPKLLSGELSVGAQES
jgi:type I restriction enzyme S subunit